MGHTFVPIERAERRTVAVPAERVGIITVVLGIACALNIFGVFVDLKTRQNRFMDHEVQNVRRDQLPLNFFLGVAAKLVGAAVSGWLCLRAVSSLPQT